MKKLFLMAVTSLSLGLSATTFAGTIMSITFESEGISPDGQGYAIYTVKCSDGDLQPMTAWDDRKKWCVGQDSTENCTKKQIKAAKKACKAD